MTGLTILLVCFAVVLLVCAAAAVYAHESDDRASESWRDAEGSLSQAMSEAGSLLDLHPLNAPEVAGVGETPTAVPAARRRAHARDIFQYTIRRPVLAVRRTVTNLGGYAEVPIRLHDRHGNRVTVHEKLRLN